MLCGIRARRRPLKMGIQKDILATADRAILPLELSNALRAYCSNSYALGLILSPYRATVCNSKDRSFAAA